MATGSGSMTMTDASLVQRAAHIVCGTAAAAISPAQAQKILADAGLDTGTTQSMPMSSMPSMPSMSGHHPADAVSSAAGSSMGLLPSLPMLLGHVLAAVAAGWVLRHGDMALLRLMRLSAHGVAEGALVRSLRAALALVRALRAGLPGTSGAAPRTPRRAPRAARKPRTIALQHSVVRRGPPRSPLSSSLPDTAHRFTITKGPRRAARARARRRLARGAAPRLSARTPPSSSD